MHDNSAERVLDKVIKVTRVGKVIHWELCKKLPFDHLNKWHMHNPESILENET